MIMLVSQALVMLADEDLKKPLKVTFVGEEGVDEGGVQKEYFQVCSACCVVNAVDPPADVCLLAVLSMLVLSILMPVRSLISVLPMLLLALPMLCCWFCRRCCSRHRSCLRLMLRSKSLSVGRCCYFAGSSVGGGFCVRGRGRCRAAMRFRMSRSIIHP